FQRHLAAARAIVAEVERQSGAEIGPREGKCGAVQVAGALLGPQDRERPRDLVVAGGEKRTRIEPRGLWWAGLALLRDRASAPPGRPRVAPRGRPRRRATRRASTSVYRAGRRRAFRCGPYDPRRRLAEDAADRLAHRVGGTEPEIALGPRAIYRAEVLEMVQLGRGEAGQAVLEQLVEERAREQMRDGNRLPAQLAQD